MDEPSMPPGLEDSPPGIVPSNTTRTSQAGSRNGKKGRQDPSPASHASVGRGSQSSGTQSNGSGAVAVGRGKPSQNKPPAKLTSASQSNTSQNQNNNKSKSNNLASFGEEPKSKKNNTTTETRPGLFKPWVNKHIPNGPDCIACVICCEPIEFFAIGECNHAEICGMCTIRQRELYKELDCCICKQELNQVIIDRSPLKFNDLVLYKVDGQSLTNSTIHITDKAYFQYCQTLFEKRCSYCYDSKVFPTMNALEKHVESAHKMLYCNLCVQNRKCFLYEQKLYSPEELPAHVEKGDPSIQLKPHPNCDYCHTVFFGIEELFVHCEDAHFKCFLCEADGNLYNYFRNYDHLEKHFGTKHFPCKQKECLEKKFVVFPTQLDLQAHNVGTHLPNERSNAKSARIVHLDFNAPSADPRSNSNNRRVAQVARASLRPVFYPDRQRTAPPTSENETFSLAGKVEERKPTQPVTTIVRPVVAPEPIIEAPPLSNAERSKNLIANVKAFLHNDAKFNTFRTLSADFRQGKITAGSYYKQFLKTFGHDQQAFGLFEEMVDLLPDAVKQSELRYIYEADKRRSNPTMASRLASAPPANPPSVPYTGSSSSSGQRVKVSETDFPTLGGGPAPSSQPSTALGTNYGSLVSGGNMKSEHDFPSLPSDNGYRSAGSAKNSSWGQPMAPNSHVVQTKSNKKSKKMVVLY